jgi:RNA polymerase sigma-70 factor (ECF subfamily)
VDTTSLSLLERLRRPGEAEAWQRFVEVYTPLLYHWARRMGLQESDSADLVQEVFTTVVQKMPAFAYDAGKSFRGWLRTIALNRWRDRQKRRAREPRDGQAQELAEAQVPDHAEAFWEAEYQRHVVGRALELMRADFQPATWRACWEFVVAGKPAAQVAAELGISENSVYVAKFRVLGRLRQELHGLMD